MTILITEPSVYLVSKPSIDWNAMRLFLEDEGLPGDADSIRSWADAPVALVEVSARLCYMSFGKGRKDIEDFILNLLYSGDGSVFEHVNYGFVFTGISRSLSHELVRHRAGFAYSQRSQRYVDEGEAGFIVPPSLIGDQDSIDVLERAVIAAGMHYQDIVSFVSASPSVLSSPEKATENRKKIRQAARSVLPNATETKMFVTGNVRAWRHFISMRATVQADLEIRRLAIRVLKALQYEAPLLFGDYKIQQELRDLTEIAASPYPKV